MNKKIVRDLLKQVKQESKDPEDIGNLNITNIIIWIEKEACEPTTIRRLVKETKHLELNCNTAKPEEVKLYVANKDVSNALQKACLKE
jgi:hypothetical protein